MNKAAQTIGPGDYQEPRCLLDMGTPFGEDARPAALPMDRITERLDSLCARRDFAAAERHLNYWLAEARSNGDRRAEFSLQGERMGFYRKQGRREEACAAAEAALALLDAAGLDSIGAGTCYVNVGTVYDNFGQPERALPYFQRARVIYERSLPPEDPRLGGLYNNMGLVLGELGRYAEARKLFQTALGIMEGTRHGPWEQAVTLLNLADLALAELGPEAAETEIQVALTRAAALLDAPEPPRSDYYVFVCEKCAPGFDYHGWFAYAAELRERTAEMGKEAGQR